VGLGGASPGAIDTGARLTPCGSPAIDFFPSFFSSFSYTTPGKNALPPTLRDQPSWWGRGRMVVVSLLIVGYPIVWLTGIEMGVLLGPKL